MSIRERPAAVEDRAVPGHWEGDLLSGSKNSYIATLVERHTRYVILMKIANKDTQTVISALIKQAKTLPNELYKSLTWDRGKELTDHRRFTLATNIDVYFYDPQSPWQRGSNENTNRLLRQYFPKGTDLSVHSQTYLNKVARRLNVFFRNSPRSSELGSTGMCILAFCRKLVSVVMDRRYRPELHYMRGPGPKWIERHGR